MNSQLTGYERINPHAPDGADVTNTSSVVLPAYLNRRYAVFTNDSDTVIYLAFADTAIAHSGIRLNANGGSFEISYKNFYVGPVSAVLDSGVSASKRLCIQEG